MCGVNMSSIQSQKSNYHHGNVREELLDAGLAHLKIVMLRALAFEKWRDKLG